MQRETQKYLFDIQQAINLLMTFTTGRSFADYQANAMLRSAVERQFEIVGEALSQLARIDEATAAALSDYRRIIAFRNILIHGYARVNDQSVWDLVEGKLPLLRQEVAGLLGL